MKIIICGSISASEEILHVQSVLQEAGHEVEIPQGVKYPEMRNLNGSAEEKAETKMKHDLIRGYYEKMKNYDAVLIVNPEKKSVPGYIGGNTLIEMAFAHILNKPLYCLYPLPDLPYTSEILAMKPIVLNGDLSVIG
jgi:hypothetical protein